MSQAITLHAINPALSSIKPKNVNHLNSFLYKGKHVDKSIDLEYTVSYPRVHQSEL